MSATTRREMPSKISGRVSPATVQAARDFCQKLAADFDEEGGHVVAAWTSSGLLLVGIRGSEARRLARLLVRERIANPDNDPADAAEHNRSHRSR